jgi:Uncharacterized protein conserved in bacteria (DUF2325)
MTVIPRFDPAVLGLRSRPQGPAAIFQLPVPASGLITRPRAGVAPVAPGRTRIWELSKHLHCSIIGTCLSTAELRQVLNKTGLLKEGASDHDLHGQGVLLAGRHDGAGKVLHKALDKRHRVTIHQFDKARTAEEIRALWQEAVKRGDIPGGYWAALTHEATSESLVRDVFGEVHMLSHLVGAANRADIRRLSALEAENIALQDKLRRQQDQLRDGITARDAKIRDLSAALVRRIGETRDDSPDDGASERAMLVKLVGDLEQRLSAEGNRRAAIARRLEAVAEELRRQQARSTGAEQRETALRAELDAIEASLAPAQNAAESETCLDGLALLYVGGRPHQLGHLRSLGERLGASFLHHDGGVEDRSGLLAGLVSRADIVMFPVDCVSHEAALMVKRLCRQAAKPFLPLRSAGLGSFVAALGRAEIAGLRAAASLPA